MLRMFFAALLAVFVVLAVSEFIGIVPDNWGSVGRMNDLLGVLAIFFVVLSFAAMAWPAAVSRFFRRPLAREYRKLTRRAARRPQTRHVHRAKGDHTDFYANLTDHICTTDDQADTSPARLIAIARQSTRVSAEWPWLLPELAEWAQNSETRLRSNIVIRFLLSERLATVSLRLQTLRGYALSFPIGPPGLTERDHTDDSAQSTKRRESRALSSAIEEHTGASILATGLHTRAGVDTVRLWHSDEILSRDPKGRRIVSDKDYTGYHLTSRIPDTDPATVSDPMDDARCPWKRKLQTSSQYLVGDRDSHVPIVDGVTVSENRWAGSVEFVLSTHSSCMAATDHSFFACKGESKDLRIGTGPLWTEKDETGEKNGRVVRRNYSEDSVLESSLAVHVVMVVTDDRNDRSLVLVRRSNTNRFGNKMLTVPGETLTLAAGGRRGYTDDFGAPDLLHHAISGVRTALGIELKPEQLRPSHVIMVNQRESVASATEGRSQLVSTVGFTASLARSRQEIETARAAASRMSQHGVQGVEFLPFGRAGGSEDEADSTVRRLLQSLAHRQSEMDQMSTTAALIVAARLLGVTRVTAALRPTSDGGGDVGAGLIEAWWKTPWAQEQCSDPRWGIPPSQSKVIQPEVATDE